MPPNSPNRPQWVLDLLRSEHAFKVVAAIFTVLICAATYGVFHLATDDPRYFNDFAVLVVIVAAFVGSLLASATLNALGADQPLIGGDRRMKLYVFGGFGAAILLALGLSVYNHAGTVSQQQREDYNRAERESRGRIESDPNVRRAAELLNERQRKQDPAKAAKP